MIAMRLLAMTISAFLALSLAAHGATPVPPIVIRTTTQAYDPVRYEAAYMIAESWGELGLEVTVEPLEFSELIGAVSHRHDFDAALLGWSGRTDRLDPQFFLGLLDSRQSGFGGNNVTGYTSPQYDAYFDEQARVIDHEQRLVPVKAAQAIAARDMPMLVLFYRDEVAGFLPAHFSDIEITPGNGLYSDWTIMQARPLTDRSRLRIGGQQSPDSLNPLRSTSVWGWKWMALYYDTLVRLSHDQGPVPWAAQSIEQIDQRTIEVKLRDGMTFHDGEPVSAHDVAFSFSYMIENDFAYFRAYLSDVEAVDAVDGLTVRFTLSRPSAAFASTTLSQIPILPHHIWHAIQSPSDLHPDDIPHVGSGPFRFTHYDDSWAMSLDRFDAHFNAENISVSGVDFFFFPDAEAMFGALLAGEIDMNAGHLEPWQAIAAERLSNIEMRVAPDFGFNHLSFNTRRHAFGDTGFRRALAFAVDRERIVDVLLDGRAQMGSSPIAPVNAFWHNPDVERFPFNIHEAFGELEAASFTWDEDGRLLMPDHLGAQNIP